MSDFERVEKWFLECGGTGKGGSALSEAISELEDGKDQANGINVEDRVDYSGRALETVEEFFTEIRHSDEAEKQRSEEETKQRFGEAEKKAAEEAAKAQELYAQQMKFTQQYMQSGQAWSYGLGNGGTGGASYQLLGNSSSATTATSASLGSSFGGWSNLFGRNK